MILQEDDFLKSLKKITSTKEGRRFISHLIDISGCNETAYLNADRLMYAKGKSFIGFYIQNAMQLHCIENYTELLRDERNLWKKEQREYEKEQERINNGL